MKRAIPFEFGGLTINPGERATVELPMARLYTSNEMTLPVQVVHGRRHGPTLFVSAAVHGDEINGVEIIRRLLASRAMKDMRGTLLAIPVANPFGFIQRARYLPDRRDLNRSFPGSLKGSLAGRIAHLFMTEIAGRCDFGIDLHTGSNFRSNLPQIRACLDDPKTIELASAFGAPIVVPSELREGSLREAVAALGKPVLVFEGGEALYFNESVIKTGMQGVIRLMRHTGMLPASKRAKHRESIITNKTSWVRAGMSGIFSRKVQLGDLVKRRSLLGTLSDPLGDEQEDIHAPYTGVVIGQLNIPLAHEGDALIHLARVPDADEAEEALDEYTSSLTDEDFGLER
ncbi:succinylglutamate desuccinylase/aspartoacylase family protein [uncultured Desulfuromusa sp.]|uniref:succinylglutamate desuccinylase/aspartoacylase family protein n=1 Tax=uncultured Desulfuromusa sp. TaxID=219183 RepID=UPI002AA60EA9|nr:succinylglutamate desuccinylase/aspartoacylase family protein [uncultured Desulfuromusa sp.]